MNSIRFTNLRSTFSGGGGPDLSIFRFSPYFSLDPSLPHSSVLRSASGRFILNVLTTPESPDRGSCRPSFPPTGLRGSWHGKLVHGVRIRRLVNTWRLIAGNLRDSIGVLSTSQMRLLVRHLCLPVINGA